MRNNIKQIKDKADDFDDRFVEAVRADAESINRRSDNKLLAILAVLLPPAYLYEGSQFKNPWLTSLFVLAIFGVITYTIYSVIKKKKHVAAKYGLACSSCGYTPTGDKVMHAAYTLQCRKCGHELNARFRSKHRA